MTHYPELFPDGPVDGLLLLISTHGITCGFLLVGPGQVEKAQARWWGHAESVPLPG